MLDFQRCSEAVNHSYYIVTFKICWDIYFAHDDTEYCGSTWLTLCCRFQDP